MASALDELDEHQPEEHMGPWSSDATGFGADEQRITWPAVRWVVIQTTDEGPYVDDVWWWIVHADGVCRLAMTDVDGPLLAAMQTHLPGFDHLAVVQAMGSCRERFFVAYDKEDAVARAAMALRPRFVALVQRLSATGDASAVADAVLQSWSTPARAYHQLDHLIDCLLELDGLVANTRLGAATDAVTASGSIDSVELALWFHDAIYDPKRHDNEARSIDFLRAQAQLLQLPSDVTETCARLIAVTEHQTQATPLNPLAQWVHDIDLAVLGRDTWRFLAFEYAVREEYAHVPWVVFVCKRGRFLDELQKRPQLFLSSYFSARYEKAARDNIAQLLASSRYRWYRWLQWPRG